MAIERLVVGAFGTNCYLFPLAEASFCAVDPGGDADAISAFLDERGAVLGAVLLTHGHFDHVAALRPLLQRFPAARIFVHEADSFRLGEDSFRHHRGEFSLMGCEGLVEKSLFPLPEATDVLRGGERILEGCVEFPDGLEVVASPGHTAGSAAFYSREKSTLFAGDTVFAFGGCGRTDLGGNEADLRRSVQKILSLPAETRILSGHGGESSVSQERPFWGWKGGGAI